MLISTEGSEPTSNQRDTAPTQTQATTTVPSERRLANRFKTAFRPGCLVIKNRIAVGLIRNMSKDGVMIEVDMQLRAGQRIAYFWDETRLVTARVAWSEGNRHGLENDTEQKVYDKSFAYRSVRVPCKFDVEVWVGGNRDRLSVANLSLGGMRLRHLHAAKGECLTISMAGFELYNAEVRWNNGREAGIRFAERLSRCQLSAVLSHDSVRFEKLVLD